MNKAASGQRLYLDCRLAISDYIRRWAGNDFTQVRAHPYDRVRDDLWPWLRQRQYASPEDDQRLDTFLRRLGRRDAHLRPSIKLWRTWPWAQAVDLDERGDDRLSKPNTRLATPDGASAPKDNQGIAS